MRAGRFFRIFAAAVAGAGLLGACDTVPMLPGIKPYRMEIQQGNVLTQEMVAKLKPGMTRQQVRFVMGSPPIADAFHQDRWDYVYYLNKGGKLVAQRRIILRFEGDTLKRIEGDVVPMAAADGKAAPGGGEVRSTGTAKTDAGAEDKNFFGRMLDKVGL